jgi:hypothetical protein
MQRTNLSTTEEVCDAIAILISREHGTSFQASTNSAQRDISRSLPLILSLRFSLKRLSASWRTSACILALEVHSFLHRIRSQPNREGYLLTSLHPGRPQSQCPLACSVTSSISDYRKQAMARMQWESLSDLYLCLDGWRAAAESIHHRNLCSCSALLDTQSKKESFD